MESTVTPDIISTGGQIMQMVTDNGITITLAVMFLALIVVGVPVLIVAMWRGIPVFTRFTDAHETIADQSAQHTEDHVIIKEGVTELCQGMEVLKDRGTTKRRKRK